MWRFMIVTILLLNNDKVIGNTAVARQNDILGPVSHIMENLSIHTQQVAHDLNVQLSHKIDGTTQTILGDIEVILASALDQLTEPIIQAQDALAKPECQQLLTMEQLRDRVDSQLATCTKYLNDVLFAFQNDSAGFSQSLEMGAEQITDLQSQCEAEEFGFGSIAACFIEKIAELNRDLAVLLNQASMTILQTRQLAKQGAESAGECANQVVADTLEYMDRILNTCGNSI